ncbi:ENTH-domain-containing protein [Tilletiaria anomala UBC 951]|uniref:ENTH-domain-containing protein n=1 Tax=Tilletiaria anomala (strain ATCC 24038 / CBS 436.72 / UBC 951) TaxID=1037660 RepID=A0A066WF75_TILAU|nr:ENTH-domain-containing protein [Tilletiaria anomala UBC 951]KDN52411.1 ENTH-domain-containing protein [Tilletiaria anomala UBC 951]
MNWDLEDVGNRLSNLTMYDVKELYRSARNYAFNISELEAKVDEATNDDPWGASTTLMAEIAQATHNYADFGEIMQAIYRRFMEKEANEWRQIYKSLTLLEYLVRNGAERVVDDARSHLSTIKILRNFHYIDEKGKDQGLNVRNRAKELAELLMDVERIRTERRKARQNKNKYQGTGNTDFVPGSGAGRYGGFSSEQYYSGGVDRYPGASGNGSGGGGGSAARQSFEEYDAGGCEIRSGGGGGSRRRAGESSSANTEAAPKPQTVVQDLFSFDDDPPATATASSSAAAAVDDFDDFQAAPPSSATPAAAGIGKKVTAAAPNGGDIFDFLGGNNGAAPAPAQSRPATGGRPAGLAAQQQPLAPTRNNTTSSFSSSAAAGASKPAQTAAASHASSSTTASINFDDLWASSAGKSTAGGAGNNKPAKMSMAEMARNQSANNVWGPAATAKPPMGAHTPAAGAGAGQKKDIFDLL